MQTDPLLTLTSGQDRRCPRRMPADWQPPVPAFTADLASMSSIVVCSLGVQANGAAPPPQLELLRERFGRSAARLEQAWHVDAQGFRNDVLICYFASPESYARADQEFAAWWGDAARLAEGVGYWRETTVAPSSHRETLFSASDRPAGLGALAATQMLGPIAEHGYWGGARDRMPAAAQDEFFAPGAAMPVERVSFGRRLRIEPGANLCVIRSGQDLADCVGRELEIYDGQVYPTLVKGMEFLRDHPRETGCYSCRFMAEIDGSGQPTQRTFGLAAFVSLGHLERWAQSHPTHLAIFNEFLAMAGQLGPQMRLRLWHEVLVLPAGLGHSFEYVNCHPATGLIPFFAPAESPRR
jgi:aldoxime dehydratase